MGRFKRWIGAIVALVSGVAVYFFGRFRSTRAKRPRQMRSTQNQTIFIGEWKFNPEKSSPGIQRASVKIELQGTDYKFTNDRLADNGTELQWWFVTDMKGDCVKSTQVNGKPMHGDTCMTRIDSNTFVKDDKFDTETFKVDRKKRTMTVEFAPKPTLVVNGRHLSKTKSVYDRVAVEK